MAWTTTGTGYFFWGNHPQEIFLFYKKWKARIEEEGSSLRNPEHIAMLLPFWSLRQVLTKALAWSSCWKTGGAGGGQGGERVGNSEKVLPSGKIEQQSRESVLWGRKQRVWGWEAESGHSQPHQQRMATGRTSTGPEHRYARSLRNPQKVKLQGSDSHLEVLHPWDY